jgi:hypothetical protein
MLRKLWNFSGQNPISFVALIAAGCAAVVGIAVIALDLAVGAVGTFFGNWSFMALSVFALFGVHLTAGEASGFGALVGAAILFWINRARALAVLALFGVHLTAAEALCVGALVGAVIIFLS